MLRFSPRFVSHVFLHPSWCKFGTSDKYFSDVFIANCEYGTPYVGRQGVNLLLNNVSDVTFFLRNSKMCTI